MKRFSILTLLLMITLIISACGAKAVPSPTLSAIDMQITAAAVALTMYAETQAAIPTATPIPPTETPTNTPLPTVTPLPLPSSGVTFTPLPNSNAGGGDECTIKVMPDVLHGETVKMRINNSTKATMRLSVYLNDTTQCGYRAYNLDPGQPLVLTDLVEGCYTLWAWNSNPDEYFIVTNGTTCIDNSNPSVFDISNSSIKLR
ncbi:MAG: hypothetical protein EHM33_24910 [Chloroflexi bacterium]|nr:MAG: hypothetical protein EHM33_24910 [Chloroflexota bacterium]